MKRVFIVGAGTMGVRICRHFRDAGLITAIVDPVAKSRDAAQATLPDVPVVAGVTALPAEFMACEMVIEAVPETLELKHKVLAELEEFLTPETLIVSNTSGLRAADLAAQMRHPERFAIAHFFNPADLIPAVEVVPGPATTPQTLQRVADLLRDTGKTPAVLKADVPGFIANRLQHAMLRECFHLLETGVADAEAIDLITRFSLGVRMALIGPMMQRDLNGLDTHLNIARYLYPDLSARQTPPEILSAKVAAGELGRKCGRGFYDWTAEQSARSEATEAGLKDLIARVRAVDTRDVDTTEGE